MNGPKRRVLPFFIPQEGCPNQCIYCDQKAASGFAASPSSRDVATALAAYDGPVPVQAAFYGGSFTALSLARQNAYLEAAAGALREGKVSSLRLSARPDGIEAETVARLRERGVATVELGLQSMNDGVLRACRRSCDSAAARAALALLKEQGMETVAHLMTGLPLSGARESLRDAFELAKLAPQAVRLSPTLVLKGTPLERLWLAGEYQPQGLQEAVGLCRDMAAVFLAHNIPVIRMGLNETNGLRGAVAAGPYHPAFGHLVYGALAREQMRMLLRLWQGEPCLLLPPAYFAAVAGDLAANKKWLRELYGEKITLRADKSLPERALALAEGPGVARWKILTWEGFLRLYTESLLQGGGDM
ncbi:MAG: radical SAM protein [Clostridiales bacterium]|nr:radical SAM protein [Clostridiales bacterium]